MRKYFCFRTQQEIALYVERYMEQMMMWRTDER